MAPNNGGEERLAPVIPIFGTRSSVSEALPKVPQRFADDDRRRSIVGDGPSRVPRLSSAFKEAPLATDAADADDADAAADRIKATDDTYGHAQEVLLRKLRGRQLSVSEARSVLRENGVGRESVEQTLEEFMHRGYLNDRTLAQVLVTAGLERKGQGRTALSRVLYQRGIAREIIAEVLDHVPDDDAERALEYARCKAPSMSRLDPDTALRRLVGQLARRGYGGPVATNAARTALREAKWGQVSVPRGPYFVESD